jgi:hypothetical protein
MLSRALTTDDNANLSDGLSDNCLSAAAMEIHFPTHGDFYLNSNLELY